MGDIKYFGLLLAVFCFAGCLDGGRDSGRGPLRPGLARLLAEADSLDLAGESYQRCLAYLDSALADYGSFSMAEKLAKYETYYSLYSTGFDWASANRMVDSILLLFENDGFMRGNRRVYGNWLLAKGNALVDLGYWREAFGYYHEGRAVIESEGDSCSMSIFTTNLGNVRNKQRKYRDAIHYYKQAFHEFENCKSQASPSYHDAIIRPQALLNGIAWFHEQLNETDSALRYYRMALGFMDAHAGRFPAMQARTLEARGVIYGNIGGLYAILGQYDEALHYLTESVGINQRPGFDHRDVQTAQIKLANVYMEAGKLAEAERQLERSRVGLDSLPNDAYESRWRKADWLLREKMGDTDRAYVALREYHRFDDSIRLANRETMEADFVREFERIDHELRVRTLQVANRQNLTLLSVSILALMMALVTAYLIYRNWQQTKRNVRQLRALNDNVNEKNKKLQLALLALQDSQQDNTRIMAMIAHDLRTPAATIQMGVSMLRQHPGQSDEERQLLEIINKSAEQALGLIGDLLHGYERDAAGSDDHMDLAAMVQDCVALMQLRANEKEQTIAVDTVPATFRGSREKIWRVISNLIVNAIKFTPRKGLIQVSLSRTEHEAVIRVQDNGIGIPGELHEHLFEISRISGREGTDGEPSTGLGLAIAKQIVTAYQGNINFDSEPGSGTTFHVHLPI